MFVVRGDTVVVLHIGDVKKINESYLALDVCQQEREVLESMTSIYRTEIGKYMEICDNYDSIIYSLDNKLLTKDKEIDDLKKIADKDSKKINRRGNALFGLGGTCLALIGTIVVLIIL